jgi:probable phosphoglycerate mutase
MPQGPGVVLLVRHGETEWSSSGRHTGRTDVPLTTHGEDMARALAPRIAAYAPALVLASPLQRAWRTAELAGLAPERDEDLVERGYGDYEGRSTTEIRSAVGDPAWSVWDAVDGGLEPLEDVATRCRRVLRRCEPVLERGGTAVLVAHAHLLRVLAAVWLALPPDRGRSFVLDAAAMGELGRERETPVIRRWNI